MVSLVGEIFIDVKTEKGNSCSPNAFNCYNSHSRLKDNFGQFAVWVSECNNSFHEIVKGSKSVILFKSRKLILKNISYRRQRLFAFGGDCKVFTWRETLKMLGGSIGRRIPRWLTIVVFFGQWSSQKTASLPSLRVDLGIKDSHIFLSVSLLGSRSTFLWFSLL